jgi:hypothetical protein
MSAPENEKQKLAAIEKKCLLLILFLSLISLIWYSQQVFWGIMLGGVVSLVNIRVLTRIVDAIFSQNSGGKFLVAAQYIIKISLLFALVYFLVSKQVVNILGFLVGFSVLLLAAMLEFLSPTKPQPNPEG